MTGETGNLLLVFRRHQTEIVLFGLAFLMYSINWYIAFLLYVLSFLTLLRKKAIKLRLDMGMILLFSAILLYSYSGMRTGLVTVSNCFWITSYSFMSYFIGVGIFRRCQTSVQLYFIFFSIFFIVAFPNIPITIYDILVNGLVNSDRDLAVLASEEVQRAITGRTVDLSLAIAGIMMFFYKSDDTCQLKLRKFFIVLAIIAELCTLHYVSRTGIVVLLLAYVLGILLKRGASLKTFLAILFLLVVAYLVINSSLGDVFASREKESSSIGNAGGRTERWELGLSQLLLNPDGYDVDDWYAHNFWLDFGREGGLLSFVMLVLFSIYTLAISIKVYLNKGIEEFLRKPILVYAIIFVSVFFSEPVHTGSPLSMYAYFIFSAITFELNHYYKAKKRTVNENRIHRII